VTALYLTWRLVFTLNLTVWWVTIPLLAAEIHTGIGLCLYTLALWDRDVRLEHRRRSARPPSVAVLIPTYNEPESVLLPSIAAAVALEPKHETWVLDDGHRESVRRLAEELGAQYLSRPDNAHAKAGNLNHALGVVNADLLAVLDADYVAGPDFLLRTIPYFDDERIAVVQTPQDFYNRDSFEHEKVGDETDRYFHEEAVFYRALAPAKNFWGGAFWCGTCAVVRTSALRAAGGVATETVTEDIHTSIRMEELGWKIVYHNEVLARGLAPSDAEQYMLQRNRWALGAMQVLRLENPLFKGQLSFGQKLAFTTTLFGWFDSWRTFTYMVLAPVILFTGASPIAAPGYQYGPAFVTVFVMQFAALRLLARGYYPPLLSLLFEVLRLPAVLPATLHLFWPRAAAFHVTAKGRVGDVRPKVRTPRLLRLLAVITVAALTWFAVTLAGVTPVRYDELPAVVGAAFFACMNLALLLWAIHRIRLGRFAGERRAGVRLNVRLRGDIDGIPCEVRDLSTTGALAYLPEPITSSPAVPVSLRVELPSGAIYLACNIRRHEREADRRIEVGLAFLEGQRKQIARIALDLLNSGTDAWASGASSDGYARAARAVLRRGARATARDRSSAA
jgi:cellulose synthase (UDP-forming)